ncbi:hypothetical protein HYX58_04315 [Candidatus Dependentiae bacterium]|nr:hypothetical protein [Candidatus Dependentiae bacterium]
MKRVLFLLIMMHHTLIVPNETIEVEDMPCAIILNFNVSNNNHVTSANDTSANSHQNLNQIEKNSEGAALATKDIQSFIGDAIKNHKLHISIVLAIGSYGLLYYYIKKGNHYLNRLDLWSSWKKEEDPIMVSLSNHAQELFREIKNRYKKDFASSLVLFIKDIQQEKRNIRWYQSLYHWAGYLHIKAFAV